MNKKTNTLLFIIGATLFNIIVTVLCFLVMLVLYSKFLYFIFPENAWGLPVMFFISIVASFFIYRWVIKLLIKKVAMEKYFDPIFGQSRKP